MSQKLKMSYGVRNQLQEKYKKEVVPELKKLFGYKNIFVIPRFEKIVVNVGINQAQAKEAQFIENIESSLKRITGQKPIKTLAKKSISTLKVRSGMIVGMKVTLRGKLMYDFFNKLVNVALPRVRDFRGIPLSSLDGQGNLSIGFREHIAFPEIRSDEVEKIHGLEVVISTTAKSDKEAKELLSLLGLPLRQ
jgi:large subunit ribosomal protein L5